MTSPLQTNTRRQRNVLHRTHLDIVRDHALENITMNFSHDPCTTSGTSIFDRVVNELVDHAQHLLIRARREYCLPGGRLSPKKFHTLHFQHGSTTTEQPTSVVERLIDGPR